MCRQHLPNGQISNALGGKCIGADGDVVSLMSCDGAGTWEMQGNSALSTALSLSAKGSSCGCAHAQVS